MPEMDMKQLETKMTELQGKLGEYFAKAADEKAKDGEWRTETKKAIEDHQKQMADAQKQLDAIDKKITDRTVADTKGKSFFDVMKEDESVKRLMDRKSGQAHFTLEGKELSDLLEGKTTITTTAAGYAGPGVLSIERIPGITMEARQTLKVRDVLYSRPTQAGVVFFVKVNAPMAIASPVVEGNVKPENAVTFTSLSERIKTIATWIPASKQVLDDFDELSGFIQSTMPYYTNLEEELQLLSGDGTGENLHGLIVQASSFNTGFLINSAGWNKIDIIGRAIQQITVAKEIPPTFVILHPTDWWGIRLTKDSFGRYILGDPQQPLTNPNIFGLTVVATTSIASGTFLVGSGDPAASEIRDRMQMQVDISTENSDYFTRNLIAIRAEKRLALVVKRPASYVSGTFTTSP